MNNFFSLFDFQIDFSRNIECVKKDCCFDNDLALHLGFLFKTVFDIIIELWNICSFGVLDIVINTLMYLTLVSWAEKKSRGPKFLIDK